ncbi:MAG: hypothetical protein E6J90_11340 [Deltaproteobacteria bacterium]|nr:MAG: hypothetical protein E6J91_19745 [Deltaproteobacteria bacterium]TMQ23088.1 MAG: hypothetical protein E6J90_11340 [Deltaproteobacteria bacterium]
MTNAAALSDDADLTHTLLDGTVAIPRPRPALHPVTALDRKIWEPELVEHVASYAAERDDAALEQLCNNVLAGALDEALVFAAIREDADLADWCGRDQHYRRRTPDEPKAAADIDIAMLYRCLRALAGDREALHAYRAVTELDQRMGGGL